MIADLKKSYIFKQLLSRVLLIVTVANYDSRTLNFVQNFRNSQLFQQLHTNYQYQIIKITNPELIEIYLFTKRKIRLLLISALREQGT